MSFIDISYFIGDLNIPNSGDAPVTERINLYIQKYEPEFLRKLLGYPLFKAFMTGISVGSPAVLNQRYLDILYGKEYTNLQGRLTQWRGIIITDNPVVNMAGQFVYKKPQYLTAGLTPGLIPAAMSATFDGTLGTDDWRGWTPIITRAGVMKPGIDYSWDPVTGILTLLKAGDKFGNMEDFFVAFDLRTDSLPSTDVFPAQSMIANYVYYWFRRSMVTQYTGIGEVVTNAENSTNQSPSEKMAQAWNEMRRWIWEFIEFMDTNTSQDATIYPEWQWIYRWDTIREFEFINPIF